MWSRLLGSAPNGNRFTISRARVYYGAVFEAKKEILVDPMTNALILLLVSDSVARMVIQEALERGGHTVMAAGDLGTAVKRLSTSKPDLLIISPYIEDISGYDTAKFLRTKCHGLPVLMVAGLIDDNRLEYRLELEGFQIFPTPYSASELLSKVNDVLSH